MRSLDITVSHLLFDEAFRSKNDIFLADTKKIGNKKDKISERMIFYGTRTNGS